MSLKLVTGPANSGKAGEVLSAYRARLAEDPVLVVPALRDVDHTLRELAATAVIGATVVRFTRLFDLIAERCGAAAARRASRLQREALAEEAVRGVRLRRLARSARGAGFARAVVRFAAELERAMVAPDELERALERWGRRGGRAGEAAALYRRYRELLDQAGVLDAELRAWRALEALRARPHDFGRTPVFLYGFDDFTPIELATIETLATAAGAPVTLSLPYERGRAAFKAVAPLFERLAAVADEHVELEPATDHYRPPARAALSHLERALYTAEPERAPAAAAVTVLAAGGERAEVELVGANVLRVLRAGAPAGEIAVVFRDPTRYASLVDQVFGAYGIPFALERRVPLAHTALGRGLLALLRCATSRGEPADVVAYLRTPGLLEYPRLADRLEAEVRRVGAQTVAETRSLWEKRRAWRLDEIDRLRRASGAAGLLVEVDRALDRIVKRGYGRQAPIFSSVQADDPRVVESVHAALRELHGLAEATGVALDVQRLHDKLARLEVELGERGGPDRVQVTSPEAVRARRFDSVFVCGLQSGEFPRPESSDPFLPDDDRRALAAASGLVLPAREATPDRERHLFYACVSRAERALYLSHRFADERGNPQVTSFLLDEVLDLFDGPLPTQRRSLSDVTWPAAEAPTEAEWRRAAALAADSAEPPAVALRQPELLAELHGERGYSAASLEAFADCPVRWLVERVLHPDELQPDPEPLVRGGYAHAVLEQTYRRLREETGSARVTPATLERAEAILLESLADNRQRFRVSPREARFRTATRRLEFDLLRHLRAEAGADTRFEPAALELAFGTDDGTPPLRLESEGVAIRGRIDRVDVDDGRAVVLDYKSGRKGYPVARWAEDNRLQVALYMLAVRELLGLDAVAGLYVPLAGPDARPRGLIRGDSAEALGRDCVRNDVLERDDFERELDAARERVRALAGRMRAGDVRPCPETCAWNGGCSYPSICREERACG